MKKLISVLLASVLLATTACSAAWVTTFDEVLAAAAPALNTVLEIAAVAQGKPVNAALEAKVTADSAALKSVVGAFASASAAAQPGVCSQIQAGLIVLGQDEQQILAIAQVNDSATEQKIIALTGLVTAVFADVATIIPNCSTKADPPVSAKNFVKNFNAELVKSTGRAGVDAYTKQHKLPAHGKLVHALTFGKVR